MYEFIIFSREIVEDRDYFQVKFGVESEVDQGTAEYENR